MESQGCCLFAKVTFGTFLTIVTLTSCQTIQRSDLGKGFTKNKSVRKTVILSDNWRFQPDITDIGEKEQWFSKDQSLWGIVTVPRAWDYYETALWQYEGVGWYSTIIDAGDFIAGQKTEIVFGRVMYYTKVWLNGEFIGENIGGYLPFSFDITKQLRPGQKNKLVVRVDNRPRIDWLPASSTIEWVQYGGILEPVKLISKSYCYIDDLIVTTTPDKDGAKITCTVKIANENDKSTEMELKIGISGSTGTTDKSMKVQCKPKEVNQVKVHITMDQADLWSPENPVLYTVIASLKEGNSIIDDLSCRIGIKKVSVNGTNIFLNGKPITIKGVNRYDEYDNSGPVVSEELLRKELALMKSTGINTIRVHYPQSSDLLSLYDEYGFMMIEEVPLNWWGWFGGSQSLDILEQAKPALNRMISRDKNHPCVIIWSMGNECATDNETGITVMRELLRLAKALDTTRLVSFVTAGDPTGHLAYDEADIICINKYNGIFTDRICNHIAEIDSLAYKPFVKELTAHRDNTTKPILITEYGAQGIKNIHGEVRYSEEFQAAYIEKIWEGINSVPGVSGGVLWCWADYYHRRNFITYAAYGPYGVVTVDRKPKKSLESLARMYGGSIPRN
jgi:beta-galactosidase/beta-glucuronidase